MDYNMYNMNSYYTQQQSYNMLANPSTFNVLQNSVCESRNRFVYINQNFINASAGMSTKVLINPNFKQTVHINPNFRKPKPSIHVNPNILKLTGTNSVIKSNIQGTSTDKLNNASITKTKPLISTKTKLVRVTNEKPLDKSVKQERRKSLCTKYKIIHSNENSTKMETNILSKSYVKNKYKIDKTLKTSKSPKKNFMKSKYCLHNVPESASKNITSIKEAKRASSKYISINGTLYKKTPNVLRKADLAKMTSGKASINKSKILLIRGQLYKLDRRQKTLKVLPLTAHSQRCSPRKHSSNTTLKQRKSNLSIKLNKSKRKVILSDIQNPTRHVLTNKMKKCNMPCPIYRKFGRCRGDETGRCIRVHNPNQVMMCTKFLQGACIDSKCSLSHKVSAEKMPTCKYFLEGRCAKEGCVYLHVKISAKAEICKDFLEGFCKKANECDKRHQFLCPDFEKSRSCPKKRCQYPHGTVVRKSNSSNKVAKRIIKKRNATNAITKAKTINIESNDEHLDKNLRYYTENAEKVISKDDGNLFEDISEKDNEISNDNVKSSDLKLLKRAQLGDLPSYIPLGNETADILLHDVKT